MAKLDGPYALSLMPTIFGQAEAAGCDSLSRLRHSAEACATCMPDLRWRSRRAMRRSITKEKTRRRATFPRHERHAKHARAAPRSTCADYAPRRRDAAIAARRFEPVEAAVVDEFPPPAAPIAIQHSHRESACELTISFSRRAVTPITPSFPRSRDAVVDPHERAAL